MPRISRRDQAALAALTDDQIAREIAAREADPSSKVKKTGFWKIKVANRLGDLQDEQARRRSARHAANVAAMGDDVQALSDYFSKHGDTQSHDALERLGYWRRDEARPAQPEAAPTFGVVVRLIGETHEGENWEAGIATQAEAERKAASGYTGAGSEARAVRFDSSEPWAQGAPVGAWHTFAPSVLSPSLERASLQGLAAWQWLAVFKAAGFTRKGVLNFAPLWRDVLDGRATLEQIAECVPGFSPHYVQAKFGRYVARAKDRRRVAPEGAMRWLVVLRWRGVVVGEMRATRVVSLETARAHMDQFAGATFAAWREYSFAPARRNLERLEAGEPLYFSYADETGAASVVIKLADQ